MLFICGRMFIAAMRSLKGRRFAYDPLVSIFIGGCYESKKDVSQGGAVYNDYGMTTIAIGNVVNSILNIKEFVYDKKLISLENVKRMTILNFEDSEEWADVLRDRRCYGEDKK